MVIGQFDAVAQSETPWFISRAHIDTQSPFDIFAQLATSGPAAKAEVPKAIVEIKANVAMIFFIKNPPSSSSITKFSFIEYSKSLKNL